MNIKGMIRGVKAGPAPVSTAPMSTMPIKPVKAPMSIPTQVGGNLGSLAGAVKRFNQGRITGGM